MQCKADIVGILDMDGFQIGKKFFSKELGVIKVGDSEASSFFFDIGLHWNELNEKDKRTCNFVQKNIHKFPFGVPRGTKAFQILDLQAIVENFYREIQIDSNSIIAFKGGHYERDLLASLRIPAVNLECFNCPKAEKLFDQLIWLETCGKHFESNAYQHCAKVEVEAFAMWLQQ